MKFTATGDESIAEALHRTPAFMISSTSSSGPNKPVVASSAFNVSDRKSNNLVLFGILRRKQELDGVVFQSPLVDLIV